jgi:FMN phosphatase YigB (HAD superfamily)
MNNKSTILFDMDGTTFDFATPLCELIQQTKTLPEEVRKRLDNISKFTKV